LQVELEAVLRLSRTIPTSELPRLLSEIEFVRATVSLRMLETRPAPEDRLLNVKQAAKRLHCSKQYLYQHSRTFSFVRRIGKKLLFSSNGLDLYLKKSR
jgi:hypothetical protein